MKKACSLLVLIALMAAPLAAQRSQDPGDPNQEALWQAYQQIQDLMAAGQDVPEELYTRYFQLDQLVNPELYERTPGGALDQLSNTCANAPVIVGPDSGQTFFYQENGVTNLWTNNCSFPDCRVGRDAFAILNVRYRDSVTVTTCGSAFDTYLCIWTAGCCGAGQLFAANNNNPQLCGSATTLQAGVARCFDPGMYYICLDGNTGAAFGSYRLAIRFHGNSCIYPNPEPTCPIEYARHEETFAEGCDEHSKIIHCGQGYCGDINAQGDLDVYALTIFGCTRDVTVSVFADDTPGRTGFGHGLDSHLRVWPVTCEAPLAVNDNFNGNPDIGQPAGTDSRVTVSLAAGTYFFEVSGRNGTTGPYEIFVEPCDCDEQ